MIPNLTSLRLCGMNFRIRVNRRNAKILLKSDAPRDINSQTI